MLGMAMPKFRIARHGSAEIPHCSAWQCRDFALLRIPAAVNCKRQRRQLPQGVWSAEADGKEDEKENGDLVQICSRTTRSMPHAFQISELVYHLAHEQINIACCHFGSRSGCAVLPFFNYARTDSLQNLVDAIHCH